MDPNDNMFLDWMNGGQQSPDPSLLDSQGPAPWQQPDSVLDAPPPPAQSPPPDSNPVPENMDLPGPQPDPVAPLPEPTPPPPVKLDKSGMPIPENAADIVAQQKPAYDAAQASNTRMTGLNQQQDVQTQNFNQDELNINLDSMAETHRIQKERDAAVSAANTKVAQAEQAIREVNPDHFWSTRSAGQQLAMMVSSAISGYYSVYNGGHNDTIEQINKAIDRDMVAQEQNLATDKFKVGQAEKARDQVTDQYGQMMNDANLKKAAMLQTAIVANNVAMAKIQSPITQEKGRQLGIQLLQEQDKLKAAAHQTEVANQMQVYQLKAAARAAASEAGARARTAKVAERNQALDEKTKGFYFDPKLGHLVADPEAVVNPKTDLATRKLVAETSKEEALAKEAAGKLIVHDAITGKELGVAGNETTAKAADAAQTAFHNVMRNMTRMDELRKQIGTTVGSRLLRGATNDALTAEYDNLRKETASSLAKLDDPSSSVRDAERDLAMERIPSYNTLTSEGPERSAAKSKAIRESSMGKIQRAMKQAGLEYDPKHYYPGDVPAAKETQAQSAARAASSFRPTPLEPITGPDELDPATGKLIPSGNIGQQYLMKGVMDDELPVQAMEQLVFRHNDPEALRYLQAVAADDRNPSAPAAQAALTRLGQ